MMVRSYRFFYPPTNGPTRNGASRNKGYIGPSVTTPTVDFQAFVQMADEIIAWGQERYANDHGSTADHQRLVDFVNIAVWIAEVGEPDGI